MTVMSATAALDAWQAAESRRAVERNVALAVLAAEGQADAAELARLPIGQRDARLLQLHARLGGGALEATAACPGCGAAAEIAIGPDELLAIATAAPPPAPLRVGGHVIEWRSPDSADLAAAATAADAASAEQMLLERCVTGASDADGGSRGAALTAEVRQALADAMAAADPLAEVLIDVTCPACSVAFVADLDVGEYVWAELRAHAGRLLREVHVLARAYGWAEADVLAMDDRRRAAYLELAGGTDR
jgi:hypothetical protein